MIDRVVHAYRHLPKGDLLGMNQRNRDLIDQLNPRRYRILADDKIVAKELMAARGVTVSRTITVVDSVRRAPRIETIVKDLDHFVIKPACGREGSGIAVLGPRTGGGWYGPSGEIWSGTDIRRRLGGILFGDYTSQASDRALIEERIFPGPILGDVPVIGLPDIRMITVHGEPVMAMVRFPTKRSSGKANLHLGAVGLGIDMRTGRTTFATCRNRPVTHHPETNQPLLGLQVAAWDRVLATARTAALAFPLRYLGIDLVITPQIEPIVLEANVRPGLEIQNANREGLWRHIERLKAADIGSGDRPVRPSPPLPGATLPDVI